MDDDIEMSDEPPQEDYSPLPPSPHQLDQLQYHISLQEIGEKLQAAANAAFPNDRGMRYSSVYVLLVCWEDEDPRLPVSSEVNGLYNVFKNIYFYNVEVWRIPSDGSHKKLNQKILDFVEVGGDKKDDLKIVYYGGHGMLARNRQSCWASRPDFKDPSYQTVKWSGIQHALEEAESDVLLLLDCCASGTANTDFGHGVTELIAACGFNTMANPVGPDSFTKALITELQLLSTAPSFTVGSLYNRMLCRMQNWMPIGQEMQKPPLHVVLTQNRKLPQSIQLSPIRPKKIQESHTPSSDQSSPSGSYLEDSQLSTNLALPFSESSSSQVSTPSSASNLSLDQQTCPRIAITIRLKETLTQSDLSTELFADWVRMMPILAEHVKIEAGFTSLSTLLVLSLPVHMWCYLEGDPAIAMMGLIKSSNLVPATCFSSEFCSFHEPEAAAGSQVSNEERPTVSNLNWGPRLGWDTSGWTDIPEIILDMYDLVVHVSAEPYFALRPEFDETFACPRKVYWDPSKYPVRNDLSFRFSTKLLQTSVKVQCPERAAPISTTMCNSKEEDKSYETIYQNCKSCDSEESAIKKQAKDEGGMLKGEDNKIEEDIVQVKEEKSGEAANKWSPLITAPRSPPSVEVVDDISRPSPALDFPGLLFGTIASHPLEFFEYQSIYPPRTPNSHSHNDSIPGLSYPQLGKGVHSTASIDSSSSASGAVSVDLTVSNFPTKSAYPSNVSYTPTLATGYSRHGVASLSSVDQLSSSTPVEDCSTTISPPANMATLSGAKRKSSEMSKDVRPTPSSLNWTQNTELVKLYNFVVTKGEEPYFELSPQWTANDEIPHKVYLDQPKKIQKGIFSCQFPNNCRKSFNRLADLERHYRNVHVITEKDYFPCDFKKCNRSTDPFTRKDHLRDHFRVYHMEDIGCAKGRKNMDPARWNKVQESWLEKRWIDPQWWRCSKCLARISCKENAWECPSCKIPCETERKERRQKYAPLRLSGWSDEQAKSDCLTCGGTGIVMDEITDGATYVTGTLCDCTGPEVDDNHYESMN